MSVSKSHKYKIVYCNLRYNKTWPNLQCKMLVMEIMVFMNEWKHANIILQLVSLFFTTLIKCSVQIMNVKTVKCNIKVSNVYTDWQYVQMQFSMLVKVLKCWLKWGINDRILHFVYAKYLHKCKLIPKLFPPPLAHNHQISL